MRLYLICLFLMLCTVPARAQYYVYAGQDDCGDLMVGIEAKLPVTEKISVFFDTRAENLTMTRTMFDRNADGTWTAKGTAPAQFPRPEHVLFIAELQIDQITIGHECRHDVDSFLPSRNKKERKNYMAYQINF